MPTIDQSELETLLRGVNGKTDVDVVFVTTPRMNKKVNGQPNPFYGRVKKRTVRKCVIGFDYATEVNDQLRKEGLDADFVAMPRKWGSRIAGTPLVEHKGELYLECKVEKTVEVQYMLDGCGVDARAVEPFLADQERPVSRQGVEREVILNVPKLASVAQLSVSGEVYDVVDAASVASITG